MRGRRDANERAIVQALVGCGCVVDRVEGKPYDLVVGRAFQNYLLEVKTRNGTLRASQVKFRREWRGQYAIVRTAEQAIAAVGL